METMAVETRPDLSALPRDVRVRIAVAETQGATWRQWDGDWLLEAPGVGIRALWAWLYPDRPLSFPNLPDYLTDPAAWGALLEKEKISLAWCHEDGGGWLAWFAEPGYRGWHEDTPGEAVCAAVLARYNIDWTTLEPVA